MILKEEYKAFVESEIQRLCENSRFPQTAKYKQHGSISVFEHSIAVAYTSCRIASRLHVTVDYESLIRGALLHDYFLYDWHDKSKEHRLHAFSHPQKAVHNACEDFQLTPKEKDIILRHMFPLIPVPPYYLESWIVCVADKICALQETLQLKEGSIAVDFK
ncbi:HD domain-containing protein [Oscillibacter sp.]|uniref:HD domain-containing protein n=1 Tax=Oscillibacter sp. TaxID=1945593 RepID=UPI00289F39C5|nr:HD domain-containing protein [Oscillibacter sp.]